QEGSTAGELDLPAEEGAVRRYQAGEGVAALPVIRKSRGEALRRQVVDLRVERIVLPGSDEPKTPGRLGIPLQRHRFGVGLEVVPVGKRARVFQDRYVRRE